MDVSAQQTLIDPILDILFNRDNFGIFVFSAILVIWVLKTVINPIRKLYSSLAKKSDMNAVVSNVSERLTELSATEDNFYMDIRTKLDTIEHMINMLENTSRTKYIEFESLKHDVEYIKAKLHDIKG